MKSWAGTTFARAAQDTGFKNCCLRSGRYDGSRKNHFFPRVIRSEFLRAEGHGLSLLTTTPTFTNLSAVPEGSFATARRGIPLDAKRRGFTR